MLVLAVPGLALAAETTEDFFEFAADPAVEAIELGGDWVQIPGPFVFNANGIVATPNGETLIF